MIIMRLNRSNPPGSRYVDVSCGFEGHADITASQTFLARQTEQAVRPMARLVRFQWNDYNWSGVSRFPHLNEQRTDLSTVPHDGSIASVESAQARLPRRNPRKQVVQGVDFLNSRDPGACFATVLWYSSLRFLHKAQTQT